MQSVEVVSQEAQFAAHLVQVLVVGFFVNPPGHAERQVFRYKKWVEGHVMHLAVFPEHVRQLESSKQYSQMPLVGEDTTGLESCVVSQEVRQTPFFWILRYIFGLPEVTQERQ